MKLCKILIVSFVAFGACYNFCKNDVTGSLSDIAMKNVEALADSEWVEGKGWTCYNFVVDDSDLENFHVVTYCGDCSSYAATYYTRPDYCTFSGMYN